MLSITHFIPYPIAATLATAIVALALVPIIVSVTGPIATIPSSTPSFLRIERKLYKIKILICKLDTRKLNFHLILENWLSVLARNQRGRRKPQKN